MVNGDTETLGLLLSDTSLLQLRESETSAQSDLGVVSDGGASDGRSERLQRSDTESESLSLSVLPSSVLSARLVEPGLDSAL